MDNFLVLSLLFLKPYNLYYLSTSYGIGASAIWQIFYKFLIFCDSFQELLASEITVKYDKRVKYLLILCEVTLS